MEPDVNPKSGLNPDLNLKSGFQSGFKSVSNPDLKSGLATIPLPYPNLALTLP
jgi:hypothetical protein